MLMGREGSSKDSITRLQSIVLVMQEQLFVVCDMR